VVLTNNPQAKSIEIAKAYGVEVEILNHKNFASREAFDSQIVTILSHYAPNLTVLAGFMRILTPVFIDAVRAINLHPSLLPRYKGLHAIERSFESGDTEVGVSVHWVSCELDGGEIIVQKSFTRPKDMPFEAFEARIKTIEKEALVEAIEKVLP